MNELLNPDEIRNEFNRQHGNDFSGALWMRLNLSIGPVLARRNMGHHSSPIYVVVIDGGVARHWMVTIKRQLKSNGSSTITPEVRDRWLELIGYTAMEYRLAKQSGREDELVVRYEQGASHA